MKKKYTLLTILVVSITMCYNNIVSQNQNMYLGTNYNVTNVTPGNTNPTNKQTGKSSIGYEIGYQYPLNFMSGFYVESTLRFGNYNINGNYGSKGDITSSFSTLGLGVGAKYNFIKWEIVGLYSGLGASYNTVISKSYEIDDKLIIPEHSNSFPNAYAGLGVQLDITNNLKGNLGYNYNLNFGNLDIGNDKFSLTTHQINLGLVLVITTTPEKSEKPKVIASTSEKKGKLGSLKNIDEENKVDENNAEKLSLITGDVGSNNENITSNIKQTKNAGIGNVTQDKTEKIQEPKFGLAMTSGDKSGKGIARSSSIINSSNKNISTNSGIGTISSTKRANIKNTGAIPEIKNDLTQVSLLQGNQLGSQNKLLRPEKQSLKSDNKKGVGLKNELTETDYDNLKVTADKLDRNEEFERILKNEEKMVYVKQIPWNEYENGYRKSNQRLAIEAKLLNLKSVNEYSNLSTMELIKYRSIAQLEARNNGHKDFAEWVMAVMSRELSPNVVENEKNIIANKTKAEVLARINERSKRRGAQDYLDEKNKRRRVKKIEKTKPKTIGELKKEKLEKTMGASKVEEDKVNIRNNAETERKKNIEKREKAKQLMIDAQNARKNKIEKMNEKKRLERLEKIKKQQERIKDSKE